ncbi:MAG: hypothetical protein V1702_00340 [Candidatus Woesearchaeota archaeon]
MGEIMKLSFSRTASLGLLILILFIIGCSNSPTGDTVASVANSDNPKIEAEAEPACVPEWTCTEWSDCSLSQKSQTRTCNDKMNCGVTAGKPALTQSCQPTISQIKQNAKNVNYDDLFRNNENYVGDLVYYRGEVTQIGDGYMRLSVTKEDFFWTDVIFVDYSGSDRYLEGDIIDLWGQVKGLYSYAAIFGNEVTVPEVDSLYVELVEKGSQEPAAAPVSSTILAKNTANGVTLTINSVEAVTKGPDWGKLTEIEYTITNNKATALSPVLLLFLYGSEDATQTKAEVRDTLDLPWISSGETVTNKVTTNAAYHGNMSLPITLKVSLMDDYPRRNVVSVEFNTFNNYPHDN